VAPEELTPEEQLRWQDEQEVRWERARLRVLDRICECRRSGIDPYPRVELRAGDPDDFVPIEELWRELHGRRVPEDER
jgi:hypothetical protein